MPEHLEPPPKIQRGRGRTRKNLDQHRREEPAYSKKRGRGRLQKHLIADADSLSHEDSNSVDGEERAMSGSSDEQEGVKECLDKCRWLEQLHRDEIEVSYVRERERECAASFLLRCVPVHTNPYTIQIRLFPRQCTALPLTSDECVGGHNEHGEFVVFNRPAPLCCLGVVNDLQLYMT
jgi:hypothetical protein